MTLLLSLAGRTTLSNELRTLLPFPDFPSTRQERVPRGQLHEPSRRLLPTSTAGRTQHRSNRASSPSPSSPTPSHPTLLLPSSVTVANSLRQNPLQELSSPQPPNPAHSASSRHPSTTARSAGRPSSTPRARTRFSSPARTSPSTSKHKQTWPPARTPL